MSCLFREGPGLRALSRRREVRLGNFTLVIAVNQIFGYRSSVFSSSSSCTILDLWSHFAGAENEVGKIRLDDLIVHLHRIYSIRSR